MDYRQFHADESRGGMQRVYYERVTNAAAMKCAFSEDCLGKDAAGYDRLEQHTVLCIRYEYKVVKKIYTCCYTHTHN